MVEITTFHEEYRPPPIVQHEFRLPDTSGVVRLHGYDPQRLVRKRNRIAKADIRIGAPPVQTFRDLLYVPGRDVLYDSEGRPVAETRLLRGPELKPIKAAAAQQVPDAVTRRDDPLIWAGRMRHQWGKFLLEGISRLWAISEFPELKLFGTGGVEKPPPKLMLLGSAVRRRPKRKKSPTFVDEFLSLSGIDRRSIRLRRSTILSEVIIPHPSVVPWGQMFSRHFELPERVAEQVCDGTADDRPVYLSRSRLREDRRWFDGEEELERRLAERGVLVVWPEELTFVEQIQLFNRHSTFLGCIGSAFHTLVFSLPGRRVRTVVLDPGRYVDVTYMMIDLLKGVEAHYLPVEFTAPRRQGRSPRNRGILDVSAALDAFVALAGI
jgi:Glycosyltransferase 61